MKISTEGITIDGKVYRNLEAQVAYLTEQVENGTGGVASNIKAGQFTIMYDDINDRNGYTYTDIEIPTDTTYQLYYSAAPQTSALTSPFDVSRLAENLYVNFHGDPDETDFPLTIQYVLIEGGDTNSSNEIVPPMVSYYVDIEGNGYSQIVLGDVGHPANEDVDILSTSNHFTMVIKENNNNIVDLTEIIVPYRSIVDIPESVWFYFPVRLSTGSGDDTVTSTIRMNYYVSYDGIYLEFGNGDMPEDDPQTWDQYSLAGIIVHPPMPVSVQ